MSSIIPYLLILYVLSKLHDRIKQTACIHINITTGKAWLHNPLFNLFTLQNNSTTSDPFLYLGNIINLKISFSSYKEYVYTQSSERTPHRAVLFV